MHIREKPLIFDFKTEDSLIFAYCTEAKNMEHEACMQRLKPTQVDFKNKEVQVYLTCEKHRKTYILTIK